SSNSARARVRVRARARTPLLLLTALLSLPARADDLSDRIRMLFSTQFAFTRDGLPIVTVALMEHQKEIVIAGDVVRVLPFGEGVRVLPSGEGGPDIRGAGDWHVTLEGGRPAKMRYFTVVERLPISDKGQVGPSLARWRARGFSPQAFEVGTVFGVSGEVLDR